MSTSERPLLLLDVDGPLNPFAARWRLRPRGYTTHRFRPTGWLERHPSVPGRKAATLRVWLKAEHGRLLAGLPCELVWATAWTHDANECISPVLGLPELPVIEWPMMFRAEEPGLLLWKARPIVEWAAGRPFAWVDDRITERERQFVAAVHKGPALLHHVDARHGLREADFAALARWARETSGR
ncbi:HAD domain-containing protein [Streptomyces daliensis]|uniref:Secreted protein n=1 Tax=Streptomyces daliensis TaxID=299421 RepID=A0A8T4IZF1_9ACTN|nr:hypothetical protein [Streptomyces daliensis]